MAQSVLVNWCNCFFFNDTATTEIYTLSLHDALPIWSRSCSACRPRTSTCGRATCPAARSEEHTSELQSRFDFVCRLLLEKKKRNKQSNTRRHETRCSITSTCPLSWT